MNKIYSNPTPYRMILLCAIFSLLLGCILKDDRLTDIQSELDRNRTKWASAMVSNYQFNFRWECYCHEAYVEPVSISVRENRIVDVTFVDGVPFTIRNLWKRRHRTVDGLFDLVQEGIDKKAYSISVEYHSELGYPVMASIDYENDKHDEEQGFEVNGLVIRE